MKIVEKRGARTGGLRVSRSFNPEPDLDNANVGRYLDACSFELVRGYVFAGISAFLFGQTPPRCIGGTTLHGGYFYLMLNHARYGQQEEKHENSIDNRWQ